MDSLVDYLSDDESDSEIPTGCVSWIDLKDERFVFVM